MDNSEADQREDPGAAQHGNFPNYYSFHPPETRTSLLPPGLLLELLRREGGLRETLLALDVGCNTGCGNRGSLTGGDGFTADQNQCLPFCHALQRDRHPVFGQPNQNSITNFFMKSVFGFHARTVGVRLSIVLAILIYLPLFCLLQELSVALFNHLMHPEGCSEALRSAHFMCCDIDPDLITRAQSTNPHPDAITFCTLDITEAPSLGSLYSYLDRFGQNSFHIGFCMSITMWIHLNHGDRGLVEFLKRLKTMCDYLLIEPQPWKCYRSAARRLRKLGRQDFDHFHMLSIHGDMEKEITKLMIEDGSSKLIHRFGTTSWDRSLLLFKMTRPSNFSV
ncbi:unnamed protein product [Ranitomeya imitator]|uniref:RNA methyltransferase n=1 Tax=Ranitomeya imitator TaxID=111125 RepID=A0ABN9M3W6_9NEOB|nr:unnamed protein product [Ranitomeya imitator]